MERKLKKIIIIVTVIIIIIVGILIYLLSTLNKEGILNKIDDEIYYSDEDIHFRNNVEKVTSKYDFFDTIICIEKYIDLLQKLDNSYYQEKNELVLSTIEIYKEELYNLLDEDYIKNYNITLKNMDEKFSKYYANISFNVENMYVIDIKEELPVYFVYGNLININNNKTEEYGFIVKRDTQNLLFTITPYDYMLENKYIENNILKQNLDKIKNTKLESNGDNYYTSNAYDDEYISKYYFDIYKTNLQANVDEIYNKMNKNYREKRFKTLQNYKNYINENYNELIKCNINQYNVETQNEYTNYICKDQFDNYYIFQETNIGEYTILLDTYTLEEEKFNKKYDIATNNEKVAMNITKIIQMINVKDYSSSYSLLSNSFKDRYFKTEENFKQYIKSNLYSYNEVNLVNFSDEISGVFTYYIEVSNKENKKDKKIKMNIIMQLLEDTKYQLSFEIID